MKHALIAVSILFAGACADDTPPVVQTPGSNQTVTQTVIINPGNAVTGPGTGNCPTVDNIGTSARLGGAEVGQAKVGDVLGLDATPKAGQTPVDAGCHASIANWTEQTPVVCGLLGNTQGFNPGLLLKAVGQCNVSVNVGGVQGFVTVNVVP